MRAFCVITASVLLMLIGAKVSAESQKKFPQDNGTSINNTKPDTNKTDSVYNTNGIKVPIKSIKNGQIYIVNKKKYIKK